jgi:molybdopterin-binding protein
MRIEQPKGQGGPVLSLRWLRSKKKIKAMMKQSIRNELPGTVKTIISDKVLSEVVIETGIGEIASVITTSSVEQMGLKVGDEVFALVKATNVSVRRQD